MDRFSCEAVLALQVVPYDSDTAGDDGARYECDESHFSIHGLAV